LREVAAMKFEDQASILSL